MKKGKYKSMHFNKIKRKIKTFYLYLPVWLIVLTAIICIIVGIVIGNGINMQNDDSKREESISSDGIFDNEDKAKTDKKQWNLILVNKWNLIPEDFNVNVTYLDNGHAIDERAYSDLIDMLGDCRDAGLEPVICSSYRTMEKQRELYNNKIEQYVSYGYSEKEAEEKAGEIVAVPGTSEHQLGLALDIVDISNQTLDESQKDTAVQKWLMNNSWKYGFILRYPTDKSEITGIIYEPWHYRYVGKKAAKEIYDAQICLEEYLNN